MLNKPEPAFYTSFLIPKCALFFALFFALITGYGQGKEHSVPLPVSVYNVEDGLDQSTVYQVLQDSRGLIWVATGGGLQYFDGTSFRSFDPPEEISSSISGNAIRNIVEICPGTLLVSTGSSILGFDIPTGKFHLIEKTSPRFAFLFEGFHHGKPLCWLSSGRLYRVGDRALYPVTLRFPVNQPLPSAFKPERSVRTKEGYIRIMSGEGYLELKEPDPQADSILEAKWFPGDFPVFTENKEFVTWEGKFPDTIHAVVRTSFTDKKGNLWFGTDGNGLLFHSPGRIMFDLAWTGFTRCLAGYDGFIWAGTFKNGLWKLPGDLGTKTRVNPQILTDELYFFDLVTDPAGRLWAITSQGVYVLDKKGMVLFHHPFQTSSAAFIRPGGEQMFLTTYGELYSCATGKNPSLTFLRKQTQVKECIPFMGSYWIGNHFGLFRKDTSAGVLSSLLFSTSAHLTTAPVYCLLPADSMVLAGTEHGIECFSAKGVRIKGPLCLGQLRHEIIYSLLADENNGIWFAGNNGAGCIPATRDRVIRFTVSNNLQSSEFNSNAALSLPGGNIYFGGIRGINRLSSADFIYHQSPPEAHLLSLSVSDTIFTEAVTPGDTVINISWKAPHFSGTVFSPDYLPAGTVSYSFFLEGFESRWSPFSSVPAFSYRDLPVGTYRLCIRTTDSFKNEGKPVCLLKIIIRPPVWKTGWFYILSSLLLITIIILVIRKIQEVKYRNLMKELEHRNAVDRERLRISQDMHDEIGSSLTQIAILSEIMKKQDEDPEERKKIIGKISGISGKVVDEMSEIIWAMNPKNDNLDSFVSYLRQHGSEYLSTAGIDANLSFPEDCPPVAMTSEQRRNLFLVVKEALHNVVRHSEATKTALEITWKNGILEFRIEDNGKGFDPEADSLSGNGMTTMRKRIGAIGGVYSIVSGSGKGTKIHFSVEL